MSSLLTRTSGDPVWLGAFPSEGDDCEGCHVAATTRCAWIWRGRLAVLQLCAACSQVAASMRSGGGVRFSVPEPERRADTPVRVEIPASALRWDRIARRHA